MGLDKKEILEGLSTDDKYAREALIYAMFDAGIMTYEEYTKLGGVMHA